jgi:hypothetical protein
MFFHCKKIVALRQAQDKLQVRPLKQKLLFKFAGNFASGARPVSTSQHGKIKKAEN